MVNYFVSFFDLKIINKIQSKLQNLFKSDSASDSF